MVHLKVTAVSFKETDRSDSALYIAHFSRAMFEQILDGSSAEEFQVFFTQEAVGKPIRVAIYPTATLLDGDGGGIIDNNLPCPPYCHP